MDISNLLTSEMLKALTDGDWPRLLTNAAIFIFIWIEVRGLKKEFKKLNSTIAKSYADGETRFAHIEDRLLVLETKTTTMKTPIGGLDHGKSL